MLKDYEYGVRLSDKVKYIREKSGMTQTELAKALGVAQSEISYIEGGYRPNENVVAVINKLYRLWYEKTEGIR